MTEPSPTASIGTAAEPRLSSSGYVSADGQPRLRMSIVGFLDIMGFSQSIENAASQSEAQKLVDRISAALADARRYVRESLAEEFESSPPVWALKFFSDNLVVGYPIDEEVAPASAAHFIIRCSQRYQLGMAANGLFIRGALSRGLLCLADDIIFGSALLECYQLESKISIVPRVILADPLRALVAESVRCDSSSSTDLSRSVCRDIDGRWFINYLEAARTRDGIDWELIARHKHAIQQSIHGVTRHDVLPKYGWSSRYHNMFCHWNRDCPGYSDELRIERADESSLIARLDELSIDDFKSTGAHDG